jgi:hypothetical protein
MVSLRSRLLYAVLACAVVGGGTAAGTVYLNERAGTAVAVAPLTTEGETVPRPSAEPSAEPAVDHDALLSEAMAAVAARTDGADLSVAVLDPETGESAGYGDGAFATASIVKVDILAALLLRAQDEGRSLTAAERTYATAMIENSDNASATALWRTIGRAGGLDAANARFGLTATEGGDGDLWGLTETTAADQLALLRQVFEEDGSELTVASRTYLQGLMEHIADGQDWGVSAAGSPAALKNGWLPRSSTGLWVINSIGRVTVDGHAYLVAALSQGNAGQADGISLVEAAAKAAVSVFTGTGTDTGTGTGTGTGASSSAAQKSS